MRIGIIGLAQSGKKSLFRLLTGAGAAPPVRADGKSSFPVGTCAVPDQRVRRLAAVYGARKTREAELEWVLFPTVPSEERARRAWFDEGREMDGLCCVIRQFTDSSVYHEEGSVDPARDLARLDLELAFADLEVIETRLERLSRETEKKTAAERERQMRLLERLKAEIESERPLRGVELTPSDEERLSGLKFLSRVRCMVAVTVDDETAADPGRREAVLSTLPLGGREAVCIAARTELELAEIADPSEREELALALGLAGASSPEGGAKARLCRAALRSLGLVTFLTGNRNEAGAHLVREGACAPEAAGVVHTDFERGFIRAEVMALDELVAAGSEAKLREQGKVATRGKDYVVREGDVLHILADA